MRHTERIPQSLIKTNKIWAEKFTKMQKLTKQIFLMLINIFINH